MWTPPWLFYVYSSPGLAVCSTPTPPSPPGLEHLVDLARDKKDACATCLNVVLRQARPLVSHPSFQQMLLKLVGSKEEIEVAKEIQKALKHPSLRAPAQRPFPYPAGPSRRRSGPTCYNCGKRGHIARTCFSRPSGNQIPKQ